jgi:hypothetical protein
MMDFAESGVLTVSQVKTLNEINHKIIGMYRVMLSEASQTAEERNGE